MAPGAALCHAPRYFKGGAGSDVTLVLPPDVPPAAPGARGDEIRRHLQGSLKLGCGWRIRDAIFGIRQPELTRLLAVIDYTVGKVAADLAAQRRRCDFRDVAPGLTVGQPVYLQDSD